jgi:pentatricopeptide repeat protein
VALEPNVQTYTTLIRELSKENNNLEAKLLINKMLEKGLVPENDISC